MTEEEGFYVEIFTYWSYEMPGRKKFRG